MCRIRHMAKKIRIWIPKHAFEAKHHFVKVTEAQTLDSRYLPAGQWRRELWSIARILGIGGDWFLKYTKWKCAQYGIR